MIIGIVGGGASGMMAALTASENANAQVILLERQARVGRKLQATGNGRCNLTNLKRQKNGYHGDNPDFADYALKQFGPEETCSWFRDMGLFTVVEESGKVYPYSDQANSVVDVLRFALEKPNVRVETGFEVKKIQRNAEGFTMTDGEKTVFCHKLIVAGGGLAGTKLGGTMSGYRLLNKLGHKVTPLRPNLVQLKTAWGGVTALKGVRANCCAQILRDGELWTESSGEIQFTEYGVSGPVIFEISRDVTAQPGKWVCKLDMLPQCREEELIEELEKRRQRNLPIEELLTGILHNRLGRVLVKIAGIKGKANTAELTDRERKDIAFAVKNMELELSGTMGMDNAQVTAGGVKTADFNPETMESRLVPGLYACGEVLDIDGDCGGYNLQWAWSSGYLAGKSAGKESL